MMINKLDYNKWLKHLDTQLNESTSQNLNFNPPKLLSQRNHKTLRTSTIYSQMPLPSWSFLKNYQKYSENVFISVFSWNCIL